MGSQLSPQRSVTRTPRGILRPNAILLYRFSVRNRATFDTFATDSAIWPNNCRTCRFIITSARTHTMPTLKFSLRKHKKYRKEFENCLCGCGRDVRQYRSRPSKFYNRKCYLSYLAKVRLIIERQTRILLFLDDKKTL